MEKQELADLLDQYESADIFPVVNRYPADLITPLGAFIAIATGSSRAFLFESVEGGESLARYSFMSANPESVISASHDRTVFERMKAELKGYRTAIVERLPSFTGGAVGCFDFSDVEGFESSLRKHGTKFEHESCSFIMVFRQILAFDHVRQELMVISLVFKESQGGKSGLEEKCIRAEAMNAELAKRLTRHILGQNNVPRVTEPSVPRPNMTKAAFLKSVDEIKEAIAAGDAYQVVLSQRFEKRTNADSVSIYRALRSLNPSPYMFLLKTGERSVIGASPEMLVRCREGKMKYRPIAGTRVRTGIVAEDRRLAEEMKNDAKECAEHTMLVDLGRNDLGKVARYGSVVVEDLMNVETFSHVQHLVSNLAATLAPGKSGFDAFEACFPAGTVSGAPKLKAIEIIYRLEPTARGLYAGAIGYFDYAGNLDTCISIRTVVLENGVAKIQAGAGIVADSVPEKEYEETLHKAAGLFRAIELAESGMYDL